MKVARRPDELEPVERAVAIGSFDGVHLGHRRVLEAAQAGRAGIEFVEDIYDPFYGGRQFSIRDLNGYMLVFYAE